jgi:hypothetical protein
MHEKNHSKIEKTTSKLKTNLRERERERESMEAPNFNWTKISSKPVLINYRVPLTCKRHMLF